MGHKYEYVKEEVDVFEWKTEPTRPQLHPCDHNRRRPCIKKTGTKTKYFKKYRFRTWKHFLKGVIVRDEITKEEYERSK